MMAKSVPASPPPGAARARARRNHLHHLPFATVVLSSFATQLPTIENQGSFDVMAYGSPEAARADQLSLSFSLSLSLSLSLSIPLSPSLSLSIYIYIHIYGGREGERERERERERKREIFFFFYPPPYLRKREGSSLCRRAPLSVTPSLGR